jgi:hypothetical protein
MNTTFIVSQSLQAAPMADFAAFFQLKYNDRSEISFMAVVNCFGVAGAQKLDARVHIYSEKMPMDTLCIEAEQAAAAGLPPRLQYGSDNFNYLPGQCLMISGNDLRYGHYSILVYPKMMEVVMEQS